MRSNTVPFRLTFPSLLLVGNKGTAWAASTVLRSRSAGELTCEGALRAKQATASTRHQGADCVLCGRDSRSTPLCFYRQRSFRRIGIVEVERAGPSSAGNVRYGSPSSMTAQDLLFASFRRLPDRGAPGSLFSKIKAVGGSSLSRFAPAQRGPRNHLRVTLVRSLAESTPSRVPCFVQPGCTIAAPARYTPPLQEPSYNFTFSVASAAPPGPRADRAPAP